MISPNFARRQRLRRYSLAALAALSIATTCPAARAQMVTVSFSGVLGTNQTDTLGLFGPVGGNLSGDPFSTSAFYNVSELVYDNDQLCEQFLDAWCPTQSGAIKVSITINGITRSAVNINLAGTRSDSGIDFHDEIGSNNAFRATSCDDRENGCYDYTAMSFIYNKSATIDNPGLPYPGSDIVISASDGTLSSETLLGNANALTFVSPFLLGKTGKGLGDLDLNTILPTLQTPDSATALAADGTSASIVLFQVTTNTPVTFTTNNGTTLLKYDPKFLTYQPTPGNTTLTVTPISIGSLIYAVALLQAPPAGVTPAYSTPITITAQQQGGQVQQAYLPLVPPPVLLVHGIWGNAASLSTIEGYLQSQQPWANNPSLVIPITYPANIAFDQKPTEDAVTAYIKQALSIANSQGIVAGRVDLVAHSMGGLVARHYSGLPIYPSIESRKQGAFHQVVTLNTPEEGSELATFLVTYNANLIDPPNKVSKDVIQAICPKALRKSETAAACLKDNGQQLGALDDTGAVFSLEPNSENIQNLPPPNIPNTNWDAVNTTVSQNYIPPISSLIFGLEQLIVSTCSGPSYCPNQNTPPQNIKQILGSGQNDAIVSVKSQTAGCIQPYCQLASFSGLAHTTTPDLPGIKKYLFDNSDVTNDPNVSSQVACWLSTGGSATCTPNPILNLSSLGTGRSETDGDTGAVLEPALKAPGKAELATPFEVLIKTPADELVSLTVEERDELDHHTKPIPVAFGSTAEGQVSANIIPILLGHVTYRLRAALKNGRWFVEDIDIPVMPSSQLPKEFHAADLFKNFHACVADGCNTGNLRYLTRPRAIFATAPGQEVDLDGRVAYRVLPQADPAVISVDNDGPFKALRPGKATIEIRFGSVVDYMYVTVDDD